jgi:hypothetical protein
MKLEGYKLVFVSVGLIGVLLIASPALADLIHAPAGEQFSELYLLGPENTAANYPFNIAVGQNYSVYVGVGNHLGSSAYYALHIKLQNHTDLLPNATTGEPSSLQPLYEYRFFVQNGKTWEIPVMFSISEASTTANQSLINKVVINNDVIDVNKIAIWDSNSTTYGYTLLVELWAYNIHSNSIEYNDRFVSLRLNFTGNTMPV